MVRHRCLVFLYWYSRFLVIGFFGVFIGFFGFFIGTFGFFIDIVGFFICFFGFFIGIFGFFISIVGFFGVASLDMQSFSFHSNPKASHLKFREVIYFPLSLSMSTGLALPER